MPRISRLAVLANPSDPLTRNQLKELNAAAPAVGLQLQLLNATTIREVEGAFESMKRERADALFVAADPFLNGRAVQLAQLAAYHQLPATYALRECAEVGGLMSYGANVGDAFRQLGAYTGRILKGTSPANLPVVQASKFELVINAGTARMLGLSVPPTLLSIADEVID